MVIAKVSGEQTPEVVLAEDHDVVQTLSPDAPDEPLRVGILPGTPGGREHLRHAQAGDAPLKDVAIHRIAVPEEIPGRRVPGKGLDQLLRRPLRGRMVGHIEVHNPTPMVRQDD
jgi:hypothetical protein